MTMLILTGPAAIQAAHRHLDAAPIGYVFRVEEAKKRRIQEEKYHAQLGDIAKQVPFFGKMRDEETVKRLLIDAFVRVVRDIAKGEGKPDPFPIQGAMLPSLDGEGVVQLGVQSRKFTVKQAALFIEYLYSYGAENSVRWTEPGLYRDAA